MAAAKLGLEIYALTTIPERAEMGDGSGGERGTSETPPEPPCQMECGQAAFTALECYYHRHVKGQSKG